MSNNADKIESIINDFNDSLADNIVEDNTLVFTAQDAEAARKAREERELEARNRTIEARKNAEELVESAKELYSKTSGEVDYITFKGKADADSLGKIIYQIGVTEDNIERITELMEGNDNPALFKCFCELEKTYLELLRTKNSYLQSIEDSFKQLTNDVEMSAAVEVTGEDESDLVTAKAKNGKDLMRLINEASERMKNEQKSNREDDGQQLF